MSVCGVSPMGGGAQWEVSMSLCGGEPVPQFLAIGCVDALPPDRAHTAARDRYDSYRAVFGGAQHAAVARLRYLLVGAGALGRELLKTWALMGLGAEGGVVVADGAPARAADAAAAARALNPAVGVAAVALRVAPPARALFCDAFFEPLSGVCAAAGAEARRYAGVLCAYYGKPLVAVGPRAGFRVAVPSLTEAAAEAPDFADCAAWARARFAECFADRPALANRFRADPHFAARADAAVRCAVRAELERDCDAWARRTFDELFAHRPREAACADPRDGRIRPRGRSARGVRRLRGCPPRACVRCGGGGDSGPARGTRQA
jgi:hypothetical protein